MECCARVVERRSDKAAESADHAEQPGDRAHTAPERSSPEATERMSARSAERLKGRGAKRAEHRSMTGREPNWLWRSRVCIARRGRAQGLVERRGWPQLPSAGPGQLPKHKNCRAPKRKRPSGEARERPSVGIPCQAAEVNGPTQKRPRSGPCHVPQWLSTRART